MGSFFLLCNIYFDRLIQLMVEGDEIWEKLKAVLLLLLLKLLLLLLKSSCFLHTSHGTLLIMKMYFLL